MAMVWELNTATPHTELLNGFVLPAVAPKLIEFVCSPRYNSQYKVCMSVLKC